MPQFSIDQEKCCRDGFCVEVCPMGLIEMKTPDSFPSALPEIEELCVNCGHCVAVCPQEAVSIRTMTPEECPPVRPELLLTPERGEHFLRFRRSVRNYKKKPVPRATLAKLIDMARYAPSGHNLQPVSWLVYEDSGLLPPLKELVVEWMRKLIGEQPEIAAPMHLDRVVIAWDMGNDRILRNAPHLIVAHAPEALRASLTSCVIGLTYLELAATILGLGACWAGYFTAAASQYPPLREALALPEGHQVFGAMMVGYQKHTYKRLPLRDLPRITWR